MRCHRGLPWLPLIALLGLPGCSNGGDNSNHASIIDERLSADAKRPESQLASAEFELAMDSHADGLDKASTALTLILERESRRRGAAPLEASEAACSAWRPAIVPCTRIRVLAAQLLPAGIDSVLERQWGIFARPSLVLRAGSTNEQRVIVAGGSPARLRALAATTDHPRTDADQASFVRLIRDDIAARTAAAVWRAACEREEVPQTYCTLDFVSSTIDKEWRRLNEPRE